ncbi:MAG: hypothetical protein M1812_008246 [Candelaria pacifica]|nr:MAG: hypothetical protein M1812_008246 [Candelaria pacifica]
MTSKFADRGRLADMEALYRELKAKSPSSTPSPKPALSMATFENRLASFTKWPHHHLLPAQMAAAGFYHKPTASSDYVACFHCNLQLDGWSNDDKPFVEHAKSSPECPWIRKVAPAIKKPAPEQPETHPPSFPCRRCHEDFASNNQLHRHIRNSRHFDRSPSKSTASLSPPATPPNGFSTASPRLLQSYRPPQKPALQQRPYTHYQQSRQPRYVHDKPIGYSGGTQYVHFTPPPRSRYESLLSTYGYSTAPPRPPTSATRRTWVERIRDMNRDTLGGVGPVLLA